MIDEERINPGHDSLRRFLRVLGPLVAGLGALLTLIGMVSFFSAFGGGGMPRYFWCAFIGLPMTGIGIAITKFAFLGAIARYSAGEVAPVGKDTFNYLAGQMQPGVRAVSGAAAEGFRRGLSPEEGGVACRKCGDPMDADARFCDQCGAPVEINCPSCGTENLPEAKFCDQCGESLKI